MTTQKFPKDTHRIITPEGCKAQMQFQNAYIDRMSKQMSRDKRGSLTIEEMQDIRRDAETHIGNFFPDWNSWDEKKQTEEIMKLEGPTLSDAMDHCVDGGEPIFFALPNKTKLAVVEKLLDTHQSRTVETLFSSVNKYGQTVFEVIGNVPERQELAVLARQATHKTALNRMLYLRDKKEEKAKSGISKKLAQKQPTPEDEEQDTQSNLLLAQQLKNKGKGM